MGTACRSTPHQFFPRDPGTVPGEPVGTQVGEAAPRETALAKIKRLANGGGAGDARAGGQRLIPAYRGHPTPSPRRGSLPPRLWRLLKRLSSLRSFFSLTP